MTSRRIEGHKNYENLLHRYRRGSLTKRIIKWTALALVVILVVYLLIAFF